MEQVTAARGRVDMYFGKVRIGFVLKFADATSLMPLLGAYKDTGKQGKIFALMAQESWS